MRTQQNISVKKKLLDKQVITPEDVLSLPRSTENYLCPALSNVCDIEFVRFKLRDMDSGTVLFDISKHPFTDNYEEHVGGYESVEESNAGRCVRYQFSPRFLELKTVGATVEFTVGSEPIKNFRMIERHYFKDTLLKSFDFDFGFCIPNSTNTCEHIYHFPKLTKILIADMINNPFETRSDSFFFVDGVLIMHNKAEYSYNGSLDN
ncbi:unc-119 lipid binding chaperone isoform X2 [Rhodnius prolixus]|uniref:unc-119 lipid binding chaperone isoform X2 n=1 Tax=Rhodnius prolixus TaxID=13249 RepID=UPI003D18C79C